MMFAAAAIAILVAMALAIARALLGPTVYDRILAVNVFGTKTVLLIAMALALARAFMGPTVYDRILAVNVFGSLTVALIAVFGFLTERPDFLDIALVYALINFIGVIAVLKFVHFRDLGHAGHDSLGEEKEAGE